MQSEIFAIQCVSLSKQRDNEREAVCSGDAHLTANYRSLKDFRDVTFAYQHTAMKTDREEERGRESEGRETILYKIH